MITGRTRVIAHIGYPTGTFQSPMIYNAWFSAQGIDAVVVPFAVEAAGFQAVIAGLAHVRNLVGALITMPHKIAAAGLAGELSAAAAIAGSCNALRWGPAGKWHGDMFDGAGFVRGVQRRGRLVAGTRALVVGAGGVGSAIAASLAEAGVGELGLFDAAPDKAASLASRLRQHYPDLLVVTGSNDPAQYAIVVNATPLGMRDSDPLPFDPARLDPAALVGEVVLKPTKLLRAAKARGCDVQEGADMLYEQIPAYLELFGLGTSTPEALRQAARQSGERLG